MSYEPPRLVVHGSIESLTAMIGEGSYCGGESKQVGLADLIQGQVSLGSCTASSA